MHERDNAASGLDTPPVGPGSDDLALPASEPLLLFDDDEEDIDAIFVRAISEMPTQPLSNQHTPPGPHERRFLLCVLLFFVSFVGGSLISLLTYPTVTIDLVPVERPVTLTTQLAIHARLLSPVTLVQSLTAQTTGTGHQDARRAWGVLTIYNGAFSPQTMAAGTVLIGKDGIRFTTAQSVIIPAANPPQVGEATVAASALQAGEQGNIAAGDITTALSRDLLVKNLATFTGGRDARDYTAVAPEDIDQLTTRLRQAVTEQFPRAFVLLAGEVAQPTDCTFADTANHSEGAEAKTVTVTLRATCRAVAYDVNELAQQGTRTLVAQTKPGAAYQLLGNVQIRILSVSTWRVVCMGIWVYRFSQGYQQFLAEQIAGESPQEARSYLLRTGVIRQATIRQTLPKDPAHIHFLVVVESES